MSQQPSRKTRRTAPPLAYANFLSSRQFHSVLFCVFGLWVKGIREVFYCCVVLCFCSFSDCSPFFDLARQFWESEINDEFLHHVCVLCVYDRVLCLFVWVKGKRGCLFLISREIQNKDSSSVLLSGV